MKKLYLTALVLMAAALIALPTTAQAANLLTNPGFENGSGSDANNWTESGLIYRTDWVDFQHFPGSTWGMHTVGSGEGFTYQEISGITGGRDYSYTIYAQRDAGTPSGNYYMKIEWYSGGSHLSGEDKIENLTLTTSWLIEPFKIVDTAPASADAVRVVFGTDAGNPISKWDEARFEVVDLANLLANPGFENGSGSDANSWTESGTLYRVDWYDFLDYSGSGTKWGIHTGNSEASFIYQDVSGITAGTEYTFSIHASRNNGTPAGNYYMKIEWYSGGSHLSGQDAIINVNPPVGALRDLPRSETLFSLVGTAPASADAVRVVFGTAAGNPISKWDETSLTAASSPVLSREVISLNGADWDFQPADEAQPSVFHYTICVPGLVDLANPSILEGLTDPPFDYNAYRDYFGNPDQGKDNFPHDYFWYKRTFTLTPSQDHEHAFIKINQSRYGAEVWLNGTSLGSYIGCYTSHKYDVSDIINYDGENTLLVRVGKKKTLPATSAAGHDNESEVFLPGIWGDASLILTSNPVIERVQIISHIDTDTAEARITIKNLESITQNITISSRVFEKSTTNPASDEITTNYTISPLEEKTLTLNLPITDMQLWSPDNPFLYNLVSKVKIAGTAIDTLTTAFGMREFKIVGSDFYLNGHRVFLKGSNIAFHRFLSDPVRTNLPWDAAWIKNILIDIPKAHNFNFFRNHLGHMYNKWYDIADEYGMMLQNEWSFSGVFTASEEQVRAEFTQWLYDNWNHPSIIIWDALNEAFEEDGRFSRGIIRDKIIPEMKGLDPTRPWECGFNYFLDPVDWQPVDFIEEHPYIYSLGPVINDYRFGYSRSIEGIQNSTTPSMIDELEYFWLKDDGSPAHNRFDIMKRWLGKDSTNEQRLKFQAFLGTELAELFRRIDADGIAPMVYLSNAEGGTSKWLTGDLANPGLLPIMAALKDAFAPFGLSIELWDRHFLINETKDINTYIFNDYTVNKSGTLRCRIVDENDAEIANMGDYSVSVPASQALIKNIAWTMPSTAGTYYLKAEIIPNGETEPVATSKKIAHVLNQPTLPSNLSDAKIMVYDPDDEILDYLTSIGLTNISGYNSGQLSGQDILILGEGALFDTNYNSRIPGITDFVKSGHSLIIIEPTYGFTNTAPSEVPFEYQLLGDLSLSMRTRPDFYDLRGYSSYCFPEDPTFPLWNNINPEHLKMFNGAFGGEISSHYDLKLEGTNRQQPLSKSGNDLEKSDVIESVDGNGVVVVSRIEIRGRLTEEADPGVDLYSRRVDPVAQQYLLNLLSTYLDTEKNWKRIDKLFPLDVKSATASSVEKKETGEENPELKADKAVDNSLSTRWASDHESSADQWIRLDFGETIEFNRIILHWEAAYAKSYKIQVSDDNSNWIDIYSTATGDGGVDEITFSPVTARYVRMYGTERVHTDWGYSLWELEVWDVKPEAVASTVQDNDPQYAASKTIDGNMTTRWSSAWSDPQWIYIQFNEPKNEPKTFNCIKLYWEAAYAKEYKIQISDDAVNWTTIYTETGGDGGIDEIRFNTVTAHYVRMYGTERGTGCGYSLYEFEAAYLKPEAVASSVEGSGLEALKAIDGDLNTRWSSQFTDDEWIYIDFKIPIDFNCIKLTWQAAYAKEYEIQISDDAVNWTTIYTETGGDGGIDKIPLGENHTARYIKMHGLKRGTVWGYSLYEFEAYSSISCRVDYLNPRFYDEEGIPVYYIGDTVEYRLYIKNLDNQDLNNLTIQCIQEYNEAGAGYNKGDPLQGAPAQTWTNQTILKTEELALTDSYYITPEVNPGLDQTHVIVTQGGVALYNNPEAGIWCPPMSEISGKVTIQGRTNHQESITFELRNPGQATPIKIREVLTDSLGNYTLPHIPEGSYDLTAKGYNTLRAKQTNITVIVGQPAANIDLRLLGGDVDNNNVVSMMDFSILRATYGTSDQRADFNGNGQVDLTDLSILRSNYGKSGAQ